MNLLGGEIVGQVLAIQLTEIQAGERLRPVDPEWVEGLAGIMARDGQLTPIEVCRLEHGGFALVTGGHRLAAASLNGWEVINAIVVSSDWAERRLREVSENLLRRGLEPVDRAEFVAELVQLARAKTGVQSSGRKASAEARWQKALKSEALDTTVIVTDAYNWSQQVADRLGFSLSSVEKDLTLHRRLLPSVRAMLARHPVYRNATALRALAKMEGEQQLQIAQMLASGAIKSVGEGISTVQQRAKPSAEAKRLAAVLGNLARMGRAERQAAFDQLAAQYTQDVRMALIKAQAA